MKFGILKERKNPPDRRVVFSPNNLQELIRKFPTAAIVVESSDGRVFKDDAYKNAGFKVVTDVADCDVFFGVKEVPIEALIPNKKYFFFSHTIKKQPHNRKLLQAILAKNIELFDHETIVKENGLRLIGFGRYAGIVGAYNGFKAIGLKLNLFHLPQASALENQQALLLELKKIQIPTIKILLTGNGKVAYGAKEMLDAMNIKQVSVEDYLNKVFDETVFCLADVLDYNKRKDGKLLDNNDFYKHPERYESDFLRFAKVTDFYIAGHFYGTGAPAFFSKDDVKKSDFKIRFIADISCDIQGPIPTTIRVSTIDSPYFGYHPESEQEVDFLDENAIVVMAVDNLPCEIPKDASEGFGEMFLEYVIPAFFDGDKNGILYRAKVTENGKLTKRFSYLQDFIESV